MYTLKNVPPLSGYVFFHENTEHFCDVIEDIRYIVRYYNTLIKEKVSLDPFSPFQYGTHYFRIDTDYLRYVPGLRVEDMNGNEIPVKDVADVIDLKRRKWSRYKRLVGIFRNGPWPGIRCHRGGRHWHRRMRTTQEIAANEHFLLDIEEYDLPIKGRRRDLPTSWDDIFSRQARQSWKRYRNHQWK